MKSVNFVPNGTPINLTNCDREPIHIPGFIQTHGFLVNTDAHGKILRCSKNFCEFINHEAEEVLGKNLAKLGPEFLDVLNLPNG